MLRSTGIAWDLRVVGVCVSYSYVTLTIVYGCIGDCYDRVLLRFMELCATASLVLLLTSSCFISDALGSNISTVAFFMEHVLLSFKHFTSSMVSGGAAAIAEAPKGELMVYCCVDRAQC